LLFRVTIAAVAVLAIHKRLRPSVSTDCNFRSLHNQAKKILLVTCIQSDYYLAQHTSFPLCSYPGMPHGVGRRRDIYVCNPLGVRSQAGIRKKLSNSLWPRRSLGPALSPRFALPHDHLLLVSLWTSGIAKAFMKISRPPTARPTRPSTGNRGPHFGRTAHRLLPATRVNRLDEYSDQAIRRQIRLEKRSCNAGNAQYGLGS